MRRWIIGVAKEAKSLDTCLPDALTGGTDQASIHFQEQAASAWRDASRSLYVYGIASLCHLISGLLSNAWVLLVLVCGWDTDKIGTAASYIRCLSCGLGLVITVYLVQFVLAYRSIDSGCHGTEEFENMSRVVTWLWWCFGITTTLLCCLGCWMVIDDDDDDDGNTASTHYVAAAQN